MRNDIAKKYALSDAQWAKIENLLPGQAEQPGATAKNNRQFVALCLITTVIPWRDLPEHFGNFRAHLKQYRALPRALTRRRYVTSWAPSIWL